MKSSFITVVDPQVAWPFIRGYARRWNLPIANADGFENALWFGAFRDGGLRAVVGMQGTNEPDTLLVYGMYGDGSGSLPERRALYDLIAMWQSLPNLKLIGNIHLPNTKMYRYAAKCGWNFKRFLPNDTRAQLEKVN